MVNIRIYFYFYVKYFLKCNIGFKCVVGVGIVLIKKIYFVLFFIFEKIYVVIKVVECRKDI